MKKIIFLSSVCSGLLFFPGLVIGSDQIASPLHRGMSAEIGIAHAEELLHRNLGALIELSKRIKDKIGIDTVSNRLIGEDRRLIDSFDRAIKGFASLSQVKVLPLKIGDSAFLIGEALKGIKMSLGHRATTLSKKSEEGSHLDKLESVAEVLIDLLQNVDQEESVEREQWGDLTFDWFKSALRMLAEALYHVIGLIKPVNRQVSSDWPLPRPTMPAGRWEMLLENSESEPARSMLLRSATPLGTERLDPRVAYTLDSKEVKKYLDLMATTQSHEKISLVEDGLKYYIADPLEQQKLSRYVKMYHLKEAARQLLSKEIFTEKDSMNIRLIINRIMTELGDLSGPIEPMLREIERESERRLREVGSPPEHHPIKKNSFPLENA